MEELLPWLYTSGCYFQQLGVASQQSALCLDRCSWTGVNSQGTTASGWVPGAEALKTAAGWRSHPRQGHRGTLKKLKGDTGGFRSGRWQVH